MSAIEQIRQRKAEQAELARYREKEALERDKSIRLAGQEEAYSAVERELMRRAQEQAMDRNMQQAAARFENRGANDYNPTFGQAMQDAGNWIGKKFNGLADSFVDVISGQPANRPNPYAKEAEMLRRDVEAEAARRAMMESK